jgi:tetratricopeptide (TPR) repeat protein
LEKAEQLMSETNWELAHAFVTRAIERAPLLVAGHTLMGELAVQVGDFDTAVASLRTAITLEPNSGAEKFMNLGQVVGGDEAAELYARGIAILRAQLAETPDNVDVRRSLSSAYCSVAELYLTDLCMADEAEHECGAAIQSALAIDENSVEALQLAASYYVSCQRPDDALQALQRSYSLWKGAIERAMAEDGAELTDDDLFLLPSYERRLDAARLFMELAQPSEAVAICGLLVQESDDVGEVWTLLAHAHVALNEWNEALECVERAENLCRKLRGDERDADLEAEVAALRAQIEPNADPNEIADDDDNNIADDDDDDDDNDNDDK